MGISQQREYQILALNDLIRINKDRIDGYNKRINSGLDKNLKDLFSQFVKQSQHNIDSLNKFVSLLGGKPFEDYSITGKFYQAWISFRSLVLGFGRKPILEFAENCEDVMKKAYQKVLEDKGLAWQNNSGANYFLESQLDQFKVSHDTVRGLYEQTLAVA